MLDVTRSLESLLTLSLSSSHRALAHVRLWASERKHLPDVDVAAAGGWRSTAAMRVSYQQADAATQLQVVEAVG